jgi:hypothetical protein
MDAHAHELAEAEVNPRQLTRTRTVAVMVVVSIVVVVVALYLFARAPLLLGLGEIAGTSRTLAVVLGWSVWGLPLALTLACVWLVRSHHELPRAVHAVIGVLVICAWLPAVALLPGRSSEAQQQLASLAMSQAPAVARSLLAGVYAGAAGTFVMPMVIIPLAAVVTGRRYRGGLAHAAHRFRGRYPLTMVLASLLALGVAVDVGVAGPPGLPINQLWPSGRSFEFNGTYVRVLAATRASGCAGIVEPARASSALEDDGCGGADRGLFTDAHDNALVAAAVIAMPTDALARKAASTLTRLDAYSVPLPTPAGYGRTLDGAAAGAIAENVGDTLIVLDDGHANGQPTNLAIAPERTLGDAVANTLIYAINGAP